MWEEIETRRKPNNCGPSLRKRMMSTVGTDDVRGESSGESWHWYQYKISCLQAP